jgi:hypothetical protein
MKYPFDDSDDKGDRPEHVNHRGSRKSILLFVCLAVILCAASFFLGRLVERGALVKAEQSPQREDHAQSTSSEPNTPEAAHSDDAIGNRIADLHGRIGKMNWKLVTPFKQFEAGEIDAQTLRRETSVPEAEILSLSLEMFELANQIQDPALRRKTVALASGVVQRQRGFAMMIEAQVSENPAAMDAGAKLFVQGRNKAIAAAVDLVGTSETPEKEVLQNLLDAYEKSGQ